MKTTNKYILECLHKNNKRVKTLQELMTVGNTYYVIIGVNYNKINTNKKYGKHEQVVLYNYPLVGIFDENMTSVCENDELPSQYSSFTLIETTNNIYGVNIIRVSIMEKFKKTEHVDLNTDIVSLLLTNDKYKQYISSLSNISYDDVFKIITREYIIEYSQKHDYLYIPISENNKLYLSKMYTISRDFKHAHKVFDKVADTTLYNIHKKIRDNISYKYTVGKELLFMLFDKLLTNNLQDVHIIDYEYKIVLFGHHLSIPCDDEQTNNIVNKLIL